MTRMVAKPLQPTIRAPLRPRSAGPQRILSCVTAVAAHGVTLPNLSTTNSTPAYADLPGSLGSRLMARDQAFTWHRALGASTADAFARCHDTKLCFMNDSTETERARRKRLKKKSSRGQATTPPTARETSTTDTLSRTERRAAERAAAKAQRRAQSAALRNSPGAHRTAKGQWVRLTAEGLETAESTYAFAELYVSAVKDSPQVRSICADLVQISPQAELQFVILMEAGDEQLFRTLKVAWSEDAYSPEAFATCVQQEFARLFPTATLPHYGIWDKFYCILHQDDEGIDVEMALAEIFILFQEKYVEATVKPDEVRAGPFTLAYGDLVTLYVRFLEASLEDDDSSFGPTRKSVTQFLTLLRNPDISSELKEKFAVVMIFGGLTVSELSRLVMSQRNTSRDAVAHFTYLTELCYEQIYGAPETPPEQNPAEAIHPFTPLPLEDFLANTLTVRDADPRRSATLLRHADYLVPLMKQQLLREFNKHAVITHLEEVRALLVSLLHMLALLEHDALSVESKALLIDLYCHMEARNANWLDQLARWKQQVQTSPAVVQKNIANYYRYKIPHGTALLDELVAQSAPSVRMTVQELVDQLDKAERKAWRRLYYKLESHDRTAATQLTALLDRAINIVGGNRRIVRPWIKGVLRLGINDVCRLALAYQPDDADDQLLAILQDQLASPIGQLTAVAARFDRATIAAVPLSKRTWERMRSTGGYLLPGQWRELLATLTALRQMTNATWDIFAERSQHILKGRAGLSANDEITPQAVSEHITLHYPDLALWHHTFREEDRVQSALRELHSWANHDHRGLQPLLVRRLIRMGLRHPEVLRSLLTLAYLATQNAKWHRRAQDVFRQIGAIRELFAEQGQRITGDIVQLMLQDRNSADTEIQAILRWARRGYSVKIIPTDPLLHEKRHDLDVSRPGDTKHIEVKSLHKKHPGDVSYISDVEQTLFTAAKQLKNATNDGLHHVQLFIWGDDDAPSALLDQQMTYLFGQHSKLQTIDAVEVFYLNARNSEQWDKAQGHLIPNTGLSE